MRPISYTITPANANLAGVAALQTTPGAANLTLTATAASLDYARMLAFTSTGNISGVTFTVTGTNSDGTTITEGVAGPNNNTVYSTKLYKTVTTIAAGGAVGTNTKVGWDGVGDLESQTIALEYANRIAAMVAVDVSGTINFTVKECFEPVCGTAAVGVNMTDVTALAAKTADTKSQISVGATGLRIVINSYTDTATLRANIVQPSNA